MFKKLFTIVFLSLFVLIFYYTEITFAQATPQGTVSATVTAQNVSISVTSGTVAYGIMAANTHRSTIAADLNQTQTVTNTGNVDIDININSADSTDWTLAATTGADQYTHMFCHTSCGTPPTNFTALPAGPSYATFQEDVTSVTSNTRNLDLRLSTPTSTTEFGEQSMTVTLQASAAS